MNGTLLGEPRPGLVALPAPVGVVDLDDTAQRRLIVTLFHDLQQFVLDPPRGQIGDAQMTFQLQRRDPVLLLRQQEHRQEPRREWQLGGLKDGSGRQRGLTVTVATLQERTRAQTHRFVLATATRADEALRPTPLLQRLFAPGTGSVRFLILSY